MGAGFQCGIVGLTDPVGSPATAVVSPNLRVTATLGPLSTLADVVQFPGPSVIGNWVVPSFRCQVGGIPAIVASSVGIAYIPSPTGLAPSGPMNKLSPDPRASGS